jgi:hypothetical protein
MYDNVDISLRKEHCPKADFLKEIPQYLTSITTTGDCPFGSFLIGYLDCLKVKVTEQNVKIYNGSICKYYFGENFSTLSRSNTQQVFEKISDALHQPFKLADITRIDFAQNLIMSYPPKVYYPYLGQAQYYDRLEQNNGIYYINNIRQLLFYGKVYEQTIKNRPIPPLYQNQNVIRYEMRFRRRLGQQLKQPVISAQLLYQDQFFRFMIKKWRNEYLSISKIKNQQNTMKPTGSKKEFLECMANMKIQDIGQSQILALIQEWQQRRAITKKQGYDLRATIIQLGKPTKEDKTDFIIELTKKIKEASIYF